MTSTATPNQTMSTEIVENITSKSLFDKWVSSLGSKLAVVLFWADFNEPSRPGGQMDQLFTSLAKRHGDATFAKVDAENAEEVVDMYNVSMVPACVLLKNGKVLTVLQGVSGPDIAKAIATYKHRVVPENKNETSSIDQRLKRLINGAPVMVFMKGNPSEPRCKFSRSLMEILQAENISFGFFDILSDDAVRQGLKTFSNWPTYPQVYVNGKLIGGLDIIKELKEENQLVTALKPMESVDTPTVPAATDDRLKRLINQSAVMLFMKGTPMAPQCGFSAKMVDILSNEKIPFDHFDILVDEGVRQRLKTYSNWPTYPQLYVKGQLIGGLDIVRELIEESGSGSLADQLGVDKQENLDDKLKHLTTMQKVVLFMKGTPADPKCGFSAQAVDLLEQAGCKAYAHFDILSDTTIREGLKKYANWPTYPQLWVDGQLVGGLDIMKDLHEEQELAEMFQ